MEEISSAMKTMSRSVALVISNMPTALKSVSAKNSPACEEWPSK